tara:strand:+ start:24489 stop:25106 length:618 start_codon:yes stop_codon:yes gene_type:complete
MATAIKASTNNATNYFNLDGLDYEKGLYAFYYDSVEKSAAGVIDETKIRVGLKSKNEIYRTLVQPKLVTTWTDGGTPATGTITCATAIVGNTATVNGLLYTGVSGVKADNTEFSIDTSDTACALDLADSITNDTRVGTLDDVTAISAVAVVTITTNSIGTAGNVVTLVSSGSTLAVSAATLTGGVNPVAYSDFDTFIAAASILIS